MNVSGVSAEAAVMAVAQQADSQEYAMAALAASQRVEKQQGAALVSLIESAALPAPGVGENLSVYA